MDCLVSLDRREDNYFLFLQRSFILGGSPGALVLGMQCYTVQKRCASSPLKPALCSALAGCGGR